MNKVIEKVEDAIADVKDGATIAVSGFFVCGVPRILLQALVKKKVKNLTLICGAGPLVGTSDFMKQLIANKQVKKLIDSYGLQRSATKGGADLFEQSVRRGEVEYEVIPMGTLAEKLRCGGAGIPALYLPTGVGSIVEKSAVTNIAKNRVPKETREFNGRKYILEYALKPDFAFVHAYQGDTEGNLRYNKTARNWNPIMAMSARVTIAEVENVMAAGEIDGDAVHTPGIYVKRIVESPRTKIEIPKL